MKELLNRFEQKAPQIVFEWNDSETDARGWTVINSLRGGAAGGGTRMRKGLDRHEVEALAKTMEIKFTVSGPAIGGAKSGIDFDPADPRKQAVLQRWYQAVAPLLKMYYGTGGDLNVDEVNEVVPITESLGLWHPQEGVVNGHFRPSESGRIQKVGQLSILRCTCCIRSRSCRCCGRFPCWYTSASIPPNPAPCAIFSMMPIGWSKRSGDFKRC
jgi:glutamate dehydrogenase (NAD(P)+)